MRRLFGLILAGVGFCSGCQSVEKQALEPLPANATALPYADLVERARRQVWAAQEIFYRDDWDELAKAGNMLLDSAQRLMQVKAEQVPTRCRDGWPKPAEEFRLAAEQLSQAARQHDAVQAAHAFQRLHLVLKQIRPD